MVAAFLGCATGNVGSGGNPGGAPGSLGSQRATVAGTVDQFAEIYGQMGRAASGPPLSFVGDVAYFATQSPDTTLVMVGLSLPNKGLVFKRDPSGRYSASYTVELSLQGRSGVVAQARDSEFVRVTSFKETSRTDESVIYRRPLKVLPGTYVLKYVVRDGNSQRAGGHVLAITVPVFASSGLSTPEPVYEAHGRLQLDSIPNYLPSPRASYAFGVDDSASIYLESYDPAKPITIQLRTPDGKVAWTGTKALPNATTGRMASGLVTVPLVRSDVGIGTILATQAGSRDTVGTRIFVGFGPGLPVLSFKDMLGYLRFFRAPSKLAALDRATPENRGARWAEFLRETDPNPNTPQNEALDAYFSRIGDANSLFATDLPRGWLSDRGMVYVGLGAPTNSYEDYASMYAGDIATLGEVPTRVRVLVWEYDQFQARIVFYDPNDIRQWRLTRQSASLFQSLLARMMNR